MNRYIFEIVGVFAVSLACGACDGGSDGHDGPAPNRQFLAADWTGDVRSDREFIAELGDAPTAGGCPAIGGWTVASVFEASPWLEAQLSSELVLPDDLAGFCRYTWPEGAAPQGALHALNNAVASGVFAALNPVTVGVSAEAHVDAATAALGEVLRDRAQWRYHHLDPAALAATHDDRVPVRLAIVDTEPFDPTLDGPSPHGRSMAELARTAACPDATAPCPVDVFTTVGLPRLPGLESDFKQGGFAASPSDVSVGILEAVERWRAADALDGVATPLIINLSLGLDLDAFANEIDASESLLTRSLQYAACRGALIIASAGNDVGLGTTGALLPAALETLPSPNNNQCLSGFGVAKAPDGGTPYQPLVHGVGGTALGVGISPITRDDSLPRLLAPASHVGVGQIHATEVITGTSVAAAITSGTAALLRSYHPGLRRSAIMQEIYDASANVPGTWAASYLGLGTGAAPAVRRLLACEALAAVCAMPGDSRCVAAPPTCDYGPAPVSMAEIAATLQALPQLEAKPLDWQDGSEQCVANDGSQHETFFVSTSEAVCSDTAAPPQARFTMPQPGGHGCPTCGLDEPTATLTMTLGCGFDTAAIVGVDTTVCDVNGDCKAFELGALKLKLDEALPVPLEAKDLPSPVDSATIQIRFANGRVTDDALIVTH